MPKEAGVISFLFPFLALATPDLSPWGARGGLRPAPGLSRRALARESGSHVSSDITWA